MHAMQRLQAIVAMQNLTAEPNSVTMLPATPALPAVEMLPATATLPAVAMLPATAMLPAVAMLPTTAMLPAVAVLPATARLPVGSSVVVGRFMSGVSHQRPRNDETPAKARVSRVELDGIEPSTSCMPCRRSSS